MHTKTLTVELDSGLVVKFTIRYSWDEGLDWEITSYEILDSTACEETWPSVDTQIDNWLYSNDFTNLPDEAT